ncbi:MAG: hypothetical protein UH249_00605 [Acutalibacteraceae bacterium]|nr:hypothetical protein [Acutalibacteraceae bacterium]
MATKIISFILSIIMTIMTSIFPGFVWPGTETMETGAFLEQVGAAFGYQVPDTGDTYYGVEPGDEYYDAVAAAAEYDVLVDYDEIKVFENADTEFVATVLVNAAGLEIDETAEIANAAEFANIAKVSTAVVNGIIPVEDDGTVSTADMSVNDITAAIAVAVGLRFVPEDVVDEFDLVDGVKTVDTYAVEDDSIVLDAEADIVAGDVFVTDDAAFKAEAVEIVDGQKVVETSDVAINEVIEKVDFEGSTDVNFGTAKLIDGNGEVISEGLFDTEGLSAEQIDNIIHGILLTIGEISFSIGDFDISAEATKTGLDFSIGTSPVDGVTVTKDYSLTNLSIDAKADVNIKTLSFNEVYLNASYDLVDKTTIAGSYYKEFGEEVKTEGEKLEAGKVFNDLVNKYILSEFDSSSIKLFTVVVPLGTTPLTFNFDIMLHIGVNGRMTITVVSEEFHGVSVINNKVSKVSDSKVIDRVVDIYGEFEIMLGLGIGLGLFGYTIVDVEVYGGIGAWVEATARFVDENGNPVFQSTYAVPVDYLAEVAAGMDFEGDIEISGHADVYGILKVGVGENSVLSLVGLCKTWTIYDRTNATFASFEFEV